jgi:peptidoglycan/LPS O-acetylase OafA/YrhL
MQSAPTATRAEPPRKGFFALDLLDNRYPALHGIRVVAILTVIQYHVTWIFWGEQGIKLDQGFVDGVLTIFFGMDLFFMLSGFLIGSILLRSLRDSGTQNLKRFYIRRVFRTFPSYWIVLGVLATAFAMTPHQRHNLPWEFAYGTNFLSLERSNVIMFWGWSLALEEQFYLTVPILFFVLHRLRSDRFRIGLLLVLWASALVTRLVIFERHKPWDDLNLYHAIYFRTHTRFDTLVAGILLAFVNDRYGAAIAKWLERPFHRALLALPSAACLWFLLRPTMFGAQTLQLAHMFLWGTVTSIMYFGAVLLLLYGRGPFQSFLGAPFFRRVATLGYGVYLVHIPIIDHVFVPIARAAQDRHVSLLVVWPLSLAATTLTSFAVAYLMHVLIEKPSLWVRERLAA